MTKARALLLAVVGAGCVGADVVPLPPAPGDARLGVLVTSAGYQTFVDPAELRSEAIAPDEPGFVRYYACDLPALGIAAAGGFSSEAAGTMFPPSDASYSLSGSPPKFEKLSGPSWLDQVRVEDLAPPVTCIDGTTRQSSDKIAGALEDLQVHDLVEASVLLNYRNGRLRLFYEDGRVVDVETDLVEPVFATRRNPSTGRMFIFSYPSSAASVTVTEVDSVHAAPGATRVRWEVLATHRPASPRGSFRDAAVFGEGQPFFCFRDDVDDVSCDGPGSNPRVLGASTEISVGEDGIYVLSSTQVRRVTDTEVLLLASLPPLLSLDTDGFDRAYGFSALGELWYLDGTPYRVSDLPPLETSFMEIVVGDFGIVALGTVGMRWIRPLGYGACNDFPFFTGIGDPTTAGNTVIIPDIGNRSLTWVHPIGRVLSDPRLGCPLAFPIAAPGE